MRKKSRNEVKIEQITFRLPRPLRKFIDERAAQERRTLAEYVRTVLEDHQRMVSVIRDQQLNS
jgi:predicted DNA-binding protein